MPLRLLIIDDDTVDRAAVRRALSLAGLDFELVETVDARRGAEAIAASTFDCVLLDYRLPECTGLEVLTRLRAEGFAAPIVMLTGHGDEQLAVDLMKAGASDYVPKGAMTASRLAQSIRQVIHVRQVEEQNRLALRSHTARLKALAEAAIALNAVLSVEAVSDRVATNAGALLKAERAVMRVVSSADPALSAAVEAVLAPLRLSGEELARADALPLLAGLGGFEAKRCLLAAPLVGRSGTRMGLLCVADSESGAFDEDDEAILVQLAHMASIAVENARLYEAAQAAIRARDDMIAIVSHDLRNPLNTIVMGAGMLKMKADKNARDPKAEENVLRIERAAQRMDRLLSDLLDVTKIDAGALTIEPAVAALAPILEEALDPVRPVAAEKRITLVSEMAPNLPAVSVDRHRLLQVLANLLGNAMKFTPSGGTIRLAADSVESTVVLRITDTGVGIAPQSLPHVFDRFWQATQTSSLGAGLGLFITKGIVEAHGGKITVESTLGSGTTFSCMFPAVTGTT